MLAIGVFVKKKEKQETFWFGDTTRKYKLRQL